MNRRQIFGLVAVMLGLTTGHAQTTMEEYNYITTGYAIQVGGGLDMKKGYRLEDVLSHVTTSASTGIVRKVEFKALFRDKEPKPCALMCILSNSSDNMKQYLCIPSSSSDQDIWQRALKRIGDFTEEDQATLSMGFAMLASYYSAR